MQSVGDCFCDCLVSCRVISTPLCPPLTDTGDILVSQQESRYQFSTSPGLWFFFFFPPLNPPSSPATQNSSNVANSFQPAGPQVFTHHPSGSAPFFVMLPDGPAFLLWMGCGDSSVLFFFGAAAPWAFPQNPHRKLSFTEKGRCILRAIAALQCFLFPKAHLIRRRAALPTASPTGEIFWGRSSITRAAMWMELWQGGRSVVGGARRLIEPRCRQLYSVPGGLLSLSRTFTDGDKVQSSLVS